MMIATRLGLRRPRLEYGYLGLQLCRGICGTRLRLRIAASPPLLVSSLDRVVNGTQSRLQRPYGIPRHPAN
jgi:hypothetical protein